ncbi:signal peptide peptidase SppA [uncultured Helicobacter sp.]|uniref:signal peptide peptidase SppA n=1 Tax=uncultured Helicobacter sp. TaxID=175537 RepID=UPI0026347F88|nr:signal peptide peptidase SppA [uncultured Helicobacter sp.]
MKIFTPIIAVLECITKYFKAFVFILIVIILLISINPPAQQPNLAKIQLKGMILDSSMLRAQIDELHQYPSLKGVLLVVNSPGGAVGASVEISDLIKELAEKLPVVVHTEGVMASGAYYASIGASKIYANRGALIGSIGVIFSGANIKPLLDKIGYEPQTIAAGEYKEIGTYYRDWSAKERTFIQNLIKEEYDTFITDVANARKLDLANAQQFAEGKVFNATKAKELGLIDDILSRNQAIAQLKILSGVEKEEWLEKSSWQSYIDSALESSLSSVLSALFGVGLQ